MDSERFRHHLINLFANLVLINALLCFIFTLITFSYIFSQRNSNVITEWTQLDDTSEDPANLTIINDGVPPLILLKRFLGKHGILLSETDSAIRISLNRTLYNATVVAGVGISIQSVGATGRSFVITNTAPDQIIYVSAYEDTNTPYASGGLTVNGTYPAYSIELHGSNATKDIILVSGNSNVSGIEIVDNSVGSITNYTIINTFASDPVSIISSDFSLAIGDSYPNFTIDVPYAFGEIFSISDDPGRLQNSTEPNGTDVTYIPVTIPGTSLSLININHIDPFELEVVFSGIYHVYITFSSPWRGGTRQFAVSRNGGLVNGTETYCNFMNGSPAVTHGHSAGDIAIDILAEFISGDLIGMLWGISSSSFLSPYNLRMSARLIQLV